MFYVVWCLRLTSHLFLLNEYDDDEWLRGMPNIFYRTSTKQLDTDNTVNVNVYEKEKDVIVTVCYITAAFAKSSSHIP